VARIIDRYTGIDARVRLGFPIFLRPPPASPLLGGEEITQTSYGERHPRGGGALAWAILAVVLVAVIAFFAVLAIRGYPGTPTMAYYGYPAFGWWFFFPFGILFIFIVLFLVSRLIFWPLGWGMRRRYWYGYGDAQEILRQRYARGEITKEQFDQMKRDLEQR